MSSFLRKNEAFLARFEKETKEKMRQKILAKYDKHPAEETGSLVNVDFCLLACG